MFFIEWKEILNASSAATLFRRNLLREQELEKPIRFSMDIESDNEDRNSSSRFLQEQENEMGCPTSLCAGRSQYLFINILYKVEYVKSFATTFANYIRKN